MCLTGGAEGVNWRDKELSEQLHALRPQLNHIIWFMLNASDTGKSTRIDFEADCICFTYSAYPVAHGNLLVSLRMRMGRAM